MYYQNVGSIKPDKNAYHSRKTNIVTAEIPLARTDLDDRPNDRMTYVFVGDVLTQMYVTEYYARFCGRTGILLSQTNKESEE